MENRFYVLMPSLWLIVLAACSSPADKAETAYQMAKRNGSPARELCARAREVAEAYLQSQNEEKYQEWDLTADAACNDADMEILQNPYR